MSEVDTINQLREQKCQSCHADAPKVSDEELAALLKEIPDWNIEIRDEVMQLEKKFSFRNFKMAMAFSNKVFDLAEGEGHHPSVLTEWGKVTVTWWTHAIGGLHKNDLICAAKTDLLFP